MRADTRGDALNRLLSAAFYGDVGAVKAAIAAGENIDGVESELGNTALMLAAYKNHNEIVSILIEAGANLEARCKGLNTALMKAAWAGSTESVRLLLEAGASVSAVDGQAMSSLTVAAFYGHLDVVKLLLERGAAPNHRDRDGYDALRNAREQGHEEIAKVLQIHGAVESGGLEESSANLGLEDLAPVLSSIVDHVDSGFTGDDVRSLMDEVRAMSLDDEKTWQFRVVVAKRSFLLTVTVFMDDIDSPDLTLFTEKPLSERIDEVLSAREK